MIELKPTGDAEMMTDNLATIGKAGAGVVGFISSKGLAGINEVLSAIVALVTIVFVIVSTWKKIIDIKAARGGKQ